jgi:hypothetical protein
MKTMLVSFLMIFSFEGLNLVSAAEASANMQPRRQPYKEGRTKHNQDPAVREALRKKIEAEHKKRMEERKKIEAQMATNRLSRPQIELLSPTRRLRPFD